MVQLIVLLVVGVGVLVYVALLYAPVYYIVAVLRRAWWGIAIAVLCGYALLIGVAGFFVYGLVPADITSRHHWTLRPVSNSLGEIHAVDLEQLHSGAFSLSAAAARRAEIRQERLTFARDWLRVAGVGIVLLALAGALWQIAPRRRFRSPRLA